MKRVFAFVLVAVLCATSASAQELDEDNKYEGTIQGSGFIAKQTTNNGVTNKPTKSGGFMVGFRYNLSRRLAVEGNYDFFRNSQKYSFSNSTTQIPVNVHAITFSGVIKLPTFASLRPFALAGGGIMAFEPRNSVSSMGNQSKGTFVYGGGLDWPVPTWKRVAFRAECRGFLYKTPDFGQSSLRMDKYTHAVVPSAGLVFIF